MEDEQLVTVSTCIGVQVTSHRNVKMPQVLGNQLVTITIADILGWERRPQVLCERTR